MKNKFARAAARLNDRLKNLSPVQIWLLGAADAALTLLVMAGILTAIVLGGK